MWQPTPGTPVQLREVQQRVGVVAGQRDHLVSLLSLDVDDDLAYGVKHANSLLAGFVAVCSLGELVVPEARSIIKKRGGMWVRSFWAPGDHFSHFRSLLPHPGFRSLGD